MWSGNASSFMPSLASLRSSTLNTAVLHRRQALFATEPLERPIWKLYPKQHSANLMPLLPTTQLGAAGASEVYVAVLLAAFPAIAKACAVFSRKRRPTGALNHPKRGQLSDSRGGYRQSGRDPVRNAVGQKNAD